MLYEKNIHDLVTFFLKELQYTKGRSFNTILAYRGDLARIFSAAGIKFPQQLSKSVVSKYVSEKIQRGVSRSSIRREVASLRSFCKFLLLKKEIFVDPTTDFSFKIRQKKVPKTVSIPFMQNLLLQKNKSQKNTKSIKYRDSRDNCMMEILYACGIRVGELVKIKIQDVDTLEKWIKIQKGKGNKDRVVPYSMRVQSVLQRYLLVRNQYWGENFSNWLFPGRGGKSHLSKRMVQNLFAKQRSYITPHMVRHTTATHLLDNGGGIREIQSLLGHASLKTTQIYTSVSVERLRKVYSDVMKVHLEE